MCSSDLDVYPCDFFVNRTWKMGNILEDTWDQIARRGRRLEFAKKKSVPHAECAACEYQEICHGGCPELRHGQRGQFEDLDWFCGSYKMLFAKAVRPLERDVRRILQSNAT